MAENLAEIFEDSGSESDFSGFGSEDDLPENENGNILADSVNEDGLRRQFIPSGYDHPWL